MKQLLLCILLFSIGILHGQYATNILPAVSSDKSISERIAYTNITIKYSSPKVKGRKIWGHLEEYDQIWRAGANMATTFTVSEDVSIQGQILPKGIYSLFIIPSEKGDWTVIFNKEFDQWGAFNYKESEDAMRIKVPASKNYHVEDLTYSIQGNGFESGTIYMTWEKVKLSFEVEVQHIELLKANLAEKLKEFPAEIHWVSYLQAAEFLIEEEKDLDQAHAWIQKSLELEGQNQNWSGQYYPREYIVGHLYWTYAKWNALQGNFPEAIAQAEKMKAITGKYVFYDKENEYEHIDEKIQRWSKTIEEK